MQPLQTVDPKKALLSFCCTLNAEIPLDRIESDGTANLAAGIGTKQCRKISPV
jgi:hypothetical protein